jgi:hypothetical protein
MGQSRRQHALHNTSCEDSNARKLTFTDACGTPDPEEMSAFGTEHEFAALQRFRQ